MSPTPAALSDKSRLAVLLEHFATIDDPRDVRRISHPLAEILLLVVCATIADCDDYDHIAAWGEAHLDFLRRHLPDRNGVPGGRWLTILMNRVNPALFSAVSRPGCAAPGPTGRTLLRSTARRRAAPTTAPREKRRSTWSPRSPPRPAWCWGRKPCPAKPTR
jgi:hypothetical protein